MITKRRGILLNRTLSDCSVTESRRNSKEDKFDEYSCAMGGHRGLRHTIGEITVCLYHLNRYFVLLETVRYNL